LSNQNAIKIEAASNPPVEEFSFNDFKTEDPPETAVLYTFGRLANPEDRTGLRVENIQEKIDTAEALIKKAEKEAAGILKQAEAAKKSTLKKARQEGWDKGHEEGLSQGLKEGLQDGEKEFEGKISEVVKILKSLTDIYQELERNNEAQLIKLALTVSERVILHEVSVSPECISLAFKEALKQLDGTHKATIKINPEDLSLLESSKEEFSNQISELAKISFEVDPEISRGDLLVETEAGRVDASLKRRFNNLCSAIDIELKKDFEIDF
jgi:flagellar assembly protein FliH